MGNLTLNERVDMLEVIVRGLVMRVEGLSQPLVIEKVKYRNRAKPKPKKKPLLEGMRIRRRNEVLADKDGV